MNLVCERLEEFLVIVQTRNHPSNEEWARVLEAICRGSEPIMGGLIFTEGGAPSALQRRQLRDTLVREKSEGQCTAVLTDSRVARMVVAALNLPLKNKIKAFAPQAEEEALLYIKAPPVLWSPLSQLLRELKTRIQPRYLPGVG
jgi:hypothetical protein